MVTGELLPSWVSTRLAVRSPAAVGEKRAVMVTVWPAAMVTGLSPKPSENIVAAGPVMAVELRTTEPLVPVFLTTTSWVAVWPRVVVGNATDVGVGTSGWAPRGAATPGPDNGTLRAAPAEWLIRSVALRVPVAVGLKVTVTVLLSPP